MDYDFPETVWNVIVPSDEVIFFRGVGIPPTRSRKLASASWSLLALASIGGAAQGHHVIFHAKGGPPPQEMDC